MLVLLWCSVGSNKQYDFEESLFRELNAFSYTFDPTLKPRDVEFMQSLPFLHFEPLGLAPTGGATEEYITLRDMVNVTGRPFIDVLKIDCEGCEYAVLTDLAEVYRKKSPPFKQLCIEFHK